MIKLKHVATLAMVGSLFAGPVLASADEYDSKIEEQQKKIDTIKISEAEAQEILTGLQENVTSLENEIEEVLDKKTTQEQKINELNQKIAELEAAIEKRDEKIKEQAREVQTTQHSTSMIDAVLEAESIGDAIARMMAMNSLVNANQETMEQQIADQEELEAVQTEAEEVLADLEVQTTKLQDKKQELAEAQLDQQVKIKELAAQLETEEATKAQLEKEKEEAEKKRQEELKRLEEQRKKEAEAQKAYEAALLKQQQEAAAQQAQAAANQQSSSGTTSNNSSSSSNSSTATTSSGWQLPVSNPYVTSPYGYREDPTGISGNFHDGVDFGGASGAAIFASKAGEVVEASYGPMAGNYVVIKHADGYYSYYLHLSSISASVGQQVGAGQTIGGMGTTGNSTGVHLHFGISTGLWSGYVNPGPLLGV